MTLGDRIVIMKSGIVQQIGTPVEVFEHPANLFVAGFIGTPQMNFFDAKLKKKDADYVVELYGKDFPLKKVVNDYLVSRNVEEKQIILGVRPEHMYIARNKSGAKKTENYISGKIFISEMMGSEFYIHVKTDDEKETVLRVPMLGLTDREKVNIIENGNIDFTFTPEVMHIFDRETETNLIPLQL